MIHDNILIMIKSYIIVYLLISSKTISSGTYKSKISSSECVFLLNLCCNKDFKAKADFGSIMCGDHTGSDKILKINHPIKTTKAT